MRCPGCATDTVPHAKFCPQCGAAFPPRCSRCGATLSPATRFCSECGLDVAAPATAVSRAVRPLPAPSTPRYLVNRMLGSQIAREGERKHVTVLFADLQSSMQLLAERDPEEARDILDPVLKIMMEAVHWYEGTVNQVMGDGIMALFGAPLAQEDHAVRACYAALRIHGEVKRDGRDRPDTSIPIAVRIGLNSGEVVVRAIGSDLQMDYSAIGQTTHVAHRMEEMAIPGTTLLAPATASLVQGYVRVSSLGPRPVKGLAQPLEAFELLGAESVRSRLQAREGRLTKFVGRADELGRLADMLQHVRGGHGHVVAAVSEAGIGKSRLYAEFLGSPHARDCLVLRTACVPYRKGPYLPVIELLRAYFHVSEHDRPFATRQKVVARLTAVGVSRDVFEPPCLWLLDVPPDEPGWQHLDPEERRRRALEAVRLLLLHESRRQPVIVLVEDLHWIDADTQTFLDALVDALGGARILLLVNYRPEHEHAWAARSYYRHLPIGGLPPDTVDELIEVLLGRDASLERLKNLIASCTDGNPFFIEEMVRTLRETNVLAGEPGRHRLAAPVETLRVPPSVQTVLATRIDRLPDDLKRLLQCAAVIGTDVPFALLREITDTAAGDLRDGVARLQAAEFLYETRLFPDIEYTFRHTLTHEVAYGSIVVERRKALHARIVDAIERLHAGRLAEHIEPLAHHTTRAELWDKAVGYLRQAGDRALDRSASREAASWFTQALRALAHLPAEAETLRIGVDVRLQLRAALYAAGDFEPMLERLHEAQDLARKLEDPRRAGWVSVYLGEHWRQAGNFGQALELMERARALGESVVDAALRLAAHQYLGLAYHAIGDFPRATAHMRTVAELPDDAAWAGQFRPTQAGSRAGFRAVSLGWLARCLAETGQFEEGRAHGFEAIRIAEAIDHPYSLVSACWGLGHVHATQGDIPQAVSVLERALTTARESGVTRLFAQVMRPLGLAYALSGRAPDGIILLEEAVRIVRSIGLVVGHSSTLAHLGEAYLLGGRAAEARSVVEEALAIAVAHGQKADEASALRLVGEVAAHRGSAGDARRFHGEAIALAESLGMRPLAARADLSLGMLLRRLGDLAARPVLEKAHTAFTTLGMPYWRTQAEAELNALG